MNQKYIILTTIFVLLMCGTASAVTHTVCASGCDYTTIQAAVTAAASYDTVYVYNGTYNENVIVGTAHLTIEGEGMEVVTVQPGSSKVFWVKADYVNISGFNMTGTSGTGSNGVYIDGYHHCNISNNNIELVGTNGIYFRYVHNSSLTNNKISRNYMGIYLYYSDNNTLTGNTANLHSYNYGSYGNAGFMLRYSNDNILLDNTANLNERGIRLSYSNNNNLTNNTVSHHGTNGIYVASSSQNNNLVNNSVFGNGIGIGISSSPNDLTNNKVHRNRIGILDTGASNNVVDNVLLDNLEPSFSLQTDSREGVIGDQIDFNFTTAYSYGIELYPSESNLQHSKSGTLVEGNFTPTLRGVYSLQINVTDTNNNLETRRYIYLINTTSSDMSNYYFRQVWPTHGQPTERGSSHDAGALLSEPPISEEYVWCDSYIGFCVDDLPAHLFSISKNINYSIQYKIDLNGSTGIQRYGDKTTSLEYDIFVMATSNTSDVFNFSVDLANDYINSWYFMSVLLVGTSGYPYIYSNATHPSYVNITYNYSTTPDMKSISNENVQILSATSNSGDTDNASIILDGVGSTYLVVQMPNTALTYTATWDGGACTGGACSFTQSAGELNFTLTLGSTHTIAITRTADTNDITLTANTYGFLCEDPSIAHPFSTIAGEFAHEICFSWLNNSGECWESYWSGDSYHSDLSIPKNDAYFVLMDGTGEIVSCGVRAAGNVAIPVGWYATYLGESTAKTLTQIKTDMQVDGTVTNLYTWDHNAGGTGAWVSVDVTPSHSVLPNQGILINNMGAPYNWDGTIS